MSLYGWTGAAEATPPIQQHQLEPLPGDAQWVSGTGETRANWIRHQYQPNWMGNPEDVAMQMAFARKIGATPSPALAATSRLINPQLMNSYDRQINPDKRPWYQFWAEDEGYVTGSKYKEIGLAILIFAGVALTVMTLKLLLWKKMTGKPWNAYNTSQQPGLQGMMDNITNAEKSMMKNLEISEK